MYKAKPFTLINEHWKKQFLSQDNVGKFSISCEKFKKKKVKVKIYCILAFKEFKRWKTNPERRAKVIKKHDEISPVIKQPEKSQFQKDCEAGVSIELVRQQLLAHVRSFKWKK